MLKLVTNTLEAIKLSFTKSQSYKTSQIKTKIVSCHTADSKPVKH